MLGSPAGHAGGATQRGLWPLAPAPAPPAAHLSNEGYSRYGVYSLFPGAGSPAPGVGVGAALYSHTSTIGRFGPGQAATPGHTSATTFHAAHKVTDSLFSTSNYTFGAPTPPPGSPYSPIPVAQLELLAKGISSSVASVVHSSNNTVFSIKKPLSLNTTDDKRCEDRCWAAVKSEKRLSSSCGCLGSPTKTKFSDSNSGCSRTNPVDWSSVCVKREPGAVPCQVAEITTSDVGASVVKVEATSPNINKAEMQVTVPQSIANGNIPIGIAVARQRLQHDLTPNSPTLGHQGLLAPITPTQSLKELNRIAEIASPGMAATATGGVTGGGAMLQCNDDRSSGLAAWPMGGAHGSALTTPTLWQYPAPMLEPMLPMPLPMPPVGFQLVRDPVSGHFLLIPTATLEQLQQAVVWPSYPQPSSHVLLPPLPPPPLAPLQLLSSSSADYLATSTTLHQHTQSTRLVALTTDTKRKLPMPLPAHTLIKIEADCTSATSTLDHTKHQVQHSVSTVMSSNTGAIYTDPSVTPLLTTHVFYQHPTTNLILSHQADPSCKSQATSPTCLTPPPEGSPLHEQDMPLSLCVQDASNQTDTHIFSEEEQMLETGTNDSIHNNNNNYCKTPVRSETPDKIDVIDSTVEIKHDQNTEVPESTTVNNNNEYEYNENKTEDYVIQTIIMPEETKEKTCKPDISGLELLSNSIVEFENSRQSAETTPIKYEVSHDLKTEEQITETNDDVLKGIAHMTLKDRESEATSTAVDDTLGGLGLLCALAEQRFMEEVVDKQQAEAKPKHKKERRCDSEERRNKKKLKRCHDLNDSKTKRFKHGTSSSEFDCDRRVEDDLINEREREKIRENELELERERLSVLKRVTGERGLTAAEKGKRDLSSDLGITAECDKRKTDKYRKDNELSGSKNNNCSCKDERSNHRTYKNRECEDEQKFTNNNNNCNNNNNNNNNNNSNDNNNKQQQSNSEWAPGFMSAVERDMRQQLADLQRQYKEKQLELSKLAPKKTETDLQNELNKANERSPSPPHLDKIDTTPVIRYASPNLLKPPTLCPITPPLEEPKCNKDVALKQDDKSYKRKSSICDSSDSTPEKIRSSKKRKVGRPKKVLTSSGLCVATETIVAKKPRSKTSLVGYLLAAKKHLQMQNKSELIYAASSPPKYSEETPTSTPTKSNKLKSHHQTGRISNNGSENEQKASKIRPKLKAETQLKQYTEDEDTAASEWEIASQTEDNEDDVVIPEPEPEEPVPTAKTQADVRCILTADHLDVDKLRVLTAMGGLFYAGQLTAIQAPDVYAITLDGERGNRPHIMSREEILRDAILEVSPTSTSELLPGTRLCAYWSQQYRCLYPGTVAEPGTPDPILDLKFVSVEFDDGDSGRIALDDIRLLPIDYPIIEYDPNPLLSLSKRRRRTSVNSVTEERRLTNQTNNPTLVTVPTPQIPIESAKSVTLLAEKENTALNRQDSHRERKRLKKRRKEKLKRMMCHDDKKKKRKHRCCDEHCKHRKHHKKHRKHKKHHHTRVEVEEQQVTEPVVVEEVAKKEIIEEEVEEEKIETTKVENKVKKTKKRKERRESNESRSKMAAFLPARQIWGWSGRGYKRVGVKGRARKQFFKSIQRGRESITVGDCAVFLSTGRPDRPYIGKIEAMWESWGTNMVVRVKWFYHPEETVGCPPNLKYPGALFESPHVDENDVQTISHKCEVLPLKDYTAKLGPEPQRYETIYDNNDIYYLAGYYDPITPSLTMEPDIPVSESNE